MAEVQQVRIFLSYSRKDVGTVNDLYEKLKSYGFSPWQDHRDILPGQDWMEAIRKAIREAPFFLACMSTHSVSHRGVIQREIREALDVLQEKLDEDIFLIPVRLEECQVPPKLARLQWVDYYQSGGFEKILAALRKGLNQLGITAPLNLRSEPIKNLSPADAGQMIKERNFYADNYWHGAGIHHEYEPKTINGDKVVMDHTTGLMWQQAGSDAVDYEQAQEYINRLNREKLAGFYDWRLPTLEEAMSLIEAKQNQDSRLYIKSLFDKRQPWIWTADQQSAYVAWAAGFFNGNCNDYDIRNDNYVRAVRSLH